jgi:anaerobic dimethyl sulfoxide reductase subunit B (iron-sulfur subunit)
VGGDQVAFFVDAIRCINCRTCEVACKDVNGLGVGVRPRRVRTYEGGDFPNVFVYNVSMACNHCEDPACLAGCPAGAYTKCESDGIVVHHPDRCIGCRYCTWVCPYGAPQFDPVAGTVRKCNLCIEEIEAGREPACVRACPMRIIEVAPLSEIRARAGATMQIGGVPSPADTRPACAYRVKEAARHA